MVSYDNFKGNIQPDTTVVIMDDSVAIGSIRVAGYELLTECMLNLQIEPDVNNLSPQVTRYISEIKTKLFGVYSDIYRVIIAQNRDLTFPTSTISTLFIPTAGYLQVCFCITDTGKRRNCFSFQQCFKYACRSYFVIGNRENPPVLAFVGIEEDCYEFRFVYRYNGYPVLLDKEKYCISITATADRVVAADANLLIFPMPHYLQLCTTCVHLICFRKMIWL